MFEPAHYAARASELEVAASRVSDAVIRESYLTLARSFREMANLTSLTQSKEDAEAVGLAERMVGRTPSPH